MRALPLAFLLVLAAPAGAQVVPQSVAFCGGQVTLTRVETRAPAASGGGLAAQVPVQGGAWEYRATFRNDAGRPVAVTLAIAGDVGQRANGPRTLPPGETEIRIGAKPAGSGGPPLRGEALAQVIRVGCP